MNVIVVNGRLGRDPETYATKGGSTVCRMSVCDDQGKNKKPIWWRVSVFGKQAESCLQYLKKGDQVTVTGAASINEFDGKDGEKKTSMEITSYQVNFGAKASTEKQEAPAAAPTEKWDELSNEDIPF